MAQQQDGSRKRRSSSFRQSTLNSYFGENKRMKPTMSFNFESDEFRMWTLDCYRHQTATDSSSLSSNNTTLSSNNKSTKKKTPQLVTPPPPAKRIKHNTTVTTNASTSTTTSLVEQLQRTPRQEIDNGVYVKNRCVYEYNDIHYTESDPEEILAIDGSI